jgi:hypothetical protein
LRAPSSISSKKLAMSPAFLVQAMPLDSRDAGRAAGENPAGLPSTV